MSHRGAAVLFLRVPAVASDMEAAYETWYDEVHIRYRMDKPHFLGAQRYEVLAGQQRYFVFYELSCPSALTSAEYLALREWEAARPAGTFEGAGSGRPGFERGLYEQVAGPSWPAPWLEAPAVYIAGHDPAVEQERAFGEWFDGEHTSAVASIPGVLALRRLVLTNVPLGPRSG